MKVLLIKDVYNLGRAGDVKKVANGYGRNYLIPQGLAVLATPGALQQIERIKENADAERVVINKEMAEVAARLEGVELVFPVRASETGKLYGSVTTSMIADGINEKAGTEITRRQIDSQPIRTIGVHKVNIRLTMDMIPEVTVIVHREGEAPETAAVEAAELGLEEAVDEGLDIASEVAELPQEMLAAEDAALKAETVSYEYEETPAEMQAAENAEEAALEEMQKNAIEAEEAAEELEEETAAVEDAEKTAQDEPVEEAPAE